MEKDSKIYIAGHSGLVGSAILRKLKSEGYTNIITRTHSELDLTRQQQVEDFFSKEKPEYVFLAAAKVGGILANSTYPAEFIYDNIMISTNIIHASYKYNVKKLLNLGSSCIYPKLAPQPLKEEYLLTGLLEPTNEPYAIAKITAIKMCRYFNEQYGTNFISVMPTNLYGPGDNFNLETSHVLPAVLRKIHLAKCLENNDMKAIRKDLLGTKVVIGNSLLVIGKESTDEELIKALNHYGIKQQITPHESRQPAVQVELWGSGSPRREFLYVDDLADAVIFLMKTLHASRITIPNHQSPITNYESRITPYEFINIGTGKDLTIKELAEMIKNIVGFKGEIDWDKTKPDGTPQKLLDVSRISELGWKAKTSLEEGIKRTYKWYVENR